MLRYVVAFLAIFSIAGCENTAPSPSPEAQFLAYCDKLLQNSSEIQKCPGAREKILKIFENEVRKNPALYSEFFENNLSLVSQVSPGMAIQMEQYASQVMREEMARLKQESTVDNLVRKEKQIADLEKTQAQLQQALEEQKKEIIRLREVSDEQSKKVPVLLVNTWLTTPCMFKINNRKTQEDWEFLVSDSDSNRTRKKEVLLPPGDYSVQFCDQFGSSSFGRSMFTAEPESPEHKGMKEHYHAVVETP